MKSVELSLPENQKISTLNTAGIIRYIETFYTDETLQEVFKPALTPEPPFTQRTFLGKEVDLDYFRVPNHWYDYQLSLEIFQRCQDAGICMRELGKAAVTQNLTSGNGVALGMVHLLGIGKTLQGANRVNAKFNRTKRVYVENVTKTGGQIRLEYKPQLTHTHAVTEHNIGAYLAVLEYLGYRVIQTEVIKDQTYSGHSNGETTIQFSWEPQGLLERMGKLVAPFITRRFFRAYARSSQYLHEFHPSLLNDYQYQIKAKEQLLESIQQEYREKLSKQDKLIEDQKKQLKAQERQLSQYQIDFKEKVNDWLSENYSDAGISVSRFASDFHTTEKTLNRRLNETFSTTANRLIKNYRIEKAKTMLHNTSISLVAELCGFSCASVFAREFKREHGVTPREFIKDSSS